ncbi:MAG: hypothetical protein AMXMBFR47_27640 [Planctomycetota bacterium]
MLRHPDFPSRFSAVVAGVIAYKEFSGLEWYGRGWPGDFLFKLGLIAIVATIAFCLNAWRDIRRFRDFDIRRLRELADQAPVGAWQYARRAVRFPPISRLGFLDPTLQINAVETDRILTVLRHLRASSTEAMQAEIDSLRGELPPFMQEEKYCPFRKYREFHWRLYRLFRAGAAIATNEPDLTLSESPPAR